MINKSLLIPVAAAGLLCVAGARGAASMAARAITARERPATVWSGVYSKADADRGKQTYARLCSRCHGVDMKGGATEPGLVGPKFFDRWHDLRLGDIVAYIQSAMPREHDFYVSAPAAREIVSLMLQESGVPPGKAPISSDIATLNQILITRSAPAR
jgi:mono/diheme cytochrome c family protein